MTSLTDLFVHESGSPGSPAVVFLHGAGASGLMWREHMARLADRFHCLAPDLPGFGRSNHLPPATPVESAALVAELIATRVPARRAHVVGLSWGGGVTHLLLGMHPGLVERAVIDDAGMLPGPGRSWLMLGIAALSPFLHTRPVIRLLSDMVGMDETGRDDLRAASPRAFRRAFLDGSKPFVSPVEMASTCPTLLVAGELEPEIRRSHAAQAAVMPNAVARFMPGLGHGWMARRTEVHVRMVEAWLTGQELPSELVPEPPSPAAEQRLRRQLAEESSDADHRLAARSR